MTYSDLEFQLRVVHFALARDEEKTFLDYGVSGAKAERPGLGKALAHVRKKDTFGIWKLDRLGAFPELSVLRHFYGVGQACAQDCISLSTPKCLGHP